MNLDHLREKAGRMHNGDGYRHEERLTAGLGIVLELIDVLREHRKLIDEIRATPATLTAHAEATAERLRMALEREVEKERRIAELQATVERKDAALVELEQKLSSRDGSLTNYIRSTVRNALDRDEATAIANLAMTVGLAAVEGETVHYAREALAHRATREQLTAAQARLAELEPAFGKLDDEFAKACRRAADAETERDELRSELEAAEKDRAAAFDSREEYAEQRDEARSRIAELEAERSEKKAKSKDASETLRQFLDLYEATEKERDALHAKLEAANGDVWQREQVNRGLEQQLHDLRAKLDVAETARIEARVRQGEAQVEVTRVGADLNEARAELERVKADRDKAADDLAEEHRHCDAMRDKLRRAEAELDRAWEATGVASTVRGITTLEDVVRTTRANLKETRAELAALKAGSGRVPEVKFVHDGFAYQMHVGPLKIITEIANAIIAEGAEKDARAVFQELWPSAQPATTAAYALTEYQFELAKQCVAVVALGPTLDATMRKKAHDLFAVLDTIEPTSAHPAEQTAPVTLSREEADAIAKEAPCAKHHEPWRRINSYTLRCDGCGETIDEPEDK